MTSDESTWGKLSTGKSLSPSAIPVALEDAARHHIPCGELLVKTSININFYMSV